MPIRSDEILTAMIESDGAFEVVSEEEIAQGLLALARRGIYVEPTSAVVVRGVEKFALNGVIDSDDVVVAVLTGTGLKATDKITSLAKQYC
jgi:threonine synthase